MDPDNYKVILFTAHTDAETLNTPATIESCIDQLIALGGFTKLDAISHQFSPNGITSVSLLSESHIAIHTWPERGVAKLVIATCHREDLPLDMFESIIYDTLHAAAVARMGLS